MKQFTRLIVSLVVVCMLVFPSGTTSNASTKSIQEVVPEGIHVLEYSKSDKAYALTSEQVNNPKTVAAVNAFLETNSKNTTAKIMREFNEKMYSENITDAHSTMGILAGTYNISDFESKHISTAAMSSKFDSTIYWDFIKSSEISGRSQATFSGMYGYEPDKISLTDKFSFVGIVVGIDVSGPNWSTTMQSATWSREETGYSSLIHIYEDITCVGYDIYIKQTTTAYFEIGATGYTVTASDSQWL
ncbi:MAG: hypothetical protein COA82_12400 [Alkaliphilus sp.]|nr:hypothetical protein [bacterium AH-315-L21]PHS29727.1 MAG: hypothetical protein COA82_12400 [Alkaliphilus sp.]